MNVSSVNPPLGNVQAELLKLFSADIPDAHLAELKSVIARFLLEKARDKADVIWDKKTIATKNSGGCLIGNNGFFKNCT